MLRQLTRLSFALVVAACLTGVGFAQNRDYDNGSMRNAIQYGYRNGYQEGFRRGREDRRAGASYHFRNHDYDHAMSGYESYMGSRRQYKEGYRQGYVAGYNDGFRGRQARDRDSFREGPYSNAMPANGSGPGYGPRPSYGHRSVAFQIGYRDGLIAGGKDRRDHKKFRPTKHDKYEDADHGYRHDYGEKKYYKRQYREGFVAGYERGYVELRGSRNG